MQEKSEAATLAWSALNIWPTLKQVLTESINPLSLRELQCLSLSFEGLTARESDIRLDCSTRTVNYHLANAMVKLEVDNKIAAIQRACWCGLL